MQKNLQISITVSAADLEQLERVIQRVPMLKRAALVRQAIHLGLQQIETDPAKVVLR